MKKIKKAIILDMDRTLEDGIYRTEDELIMILRPNLDELIAKLQEAKAKDIDIILCTTARNEWVNRFLKLKPKFKAIFNKMFTRDNEEQWRNYSKEKYPLEYKATSENINLEYSKPVTTFGYNQILFIDDSKIEELRLQMLFEMTQGKLEKDVTFFSAFGFNEGYIAYSKMQDYKKLARINLVFSQKLSEYIEVENSNPGCKMMCSVIDYFMNKEFTNGLTCVDEDYLEEYKKFDEKLSSLRKELEQLNKDSDNKVNYIE